MPAASPSALITIGKLQFFKKVIAVSESSNIPKFAVGISNFLVGESIMKSDNRVTFIQELIKA